MVKQMVKTLLYYTQEMLTFLLILSVFQAFNDIPLFTLSHYLWIAFVFITSASFISLVGKKIKKPYYLYLVLIFVLCFVGIFVWQLTFFSALLLTIYPVCRMNPILHDPLDVDELFKRFIWFISIFILGFVFLTMWSFTYIHELMFIYLIVQVCMLLLGLWMFSYVIYYNDDNLKDMSVVKWFKNQGVLLFVSLSFILLMMVGPYLLKMIKFLILGLLTVLLTIISPVLKVIVNWVYILLTNAPLLKQDKMELDSDDNAQLEWEPFEGPYPVATTIGVLLIVLIIAFIVLFIIFNLLIVPRWKESRVVQPNSSNKLMTKSWRKRGKKLNWAQDEIRRLYQELLFYADKKLIPITSMDTARTWGVEYQATEEMERIWQRINQIYEQKRYGHEPLDEKDIAAFKKEIQLAKKELNRYNKEKKVENKEEKNKKEPK